MWTILESVIVYLGGQYNNIDIQRGAVENENCFELFGFTRFQSRISANDARGRRFQFKTVGGVPWL